MTTEMLEQLPDKVSKLHFLHARAHASGQVFSSILLGLCANDNASCSDKDLVASIDKWPDALHPNGLSQLDKRFQHRSLVYDLHAFGRLVDDENAGAAGEEDDEAKGEGSTGGGSRSSTANANESRRQLVCAYAKASSSLVASVLKDLLDNNMITIDDKRFADYRRVLCRLLLLNWLWGGRASRRQRTSTTTRCFQAAHTT